MNDRLAINRLLFDIAGHKYLTEAEVKELIGEMRKPRKPAIIECKCKKCGYQPEAEQKGDWNVFKLKCPHCNIQLGVEVK